MRKSAYIFAVTTENERQTKAMAARLAHMLRPGDLIALTGTLGSGKTTFTKGIAKGLGIADSEYVNSPSFVLIREYKARVNLYHFDLYRLDALSEIEYLSPEEYTNSDGVVVIEWAEKLKGLLPAEHLQIQIKIVSEAKRRFIFFPFGERYDTLMRRYIKQ